MGTIPRMRRPLAFLAALALTLLGAAACTGGSGGATAAGDPLPAGTDLLKGAAAEMRTVTSAAFDISTDGQADALPLSAARGGITSSGNATGTARLDQGGSTVELTFVIKDGTLYVNGLTGGWQKLPLAAAAAVYDPSAILSPDRGVAHVMDTATGTTEARETVDGVDAYNVKATLDGPALGALVPGVTGAVTGTVWIGADRKLVHKIRFPVPGQSGTVTVAFRDFDKPVTVDAPV
jgi:lipoprotein LprG